MISPEAPPGVLIVAAHHENMAAGLKTYQMGEGPNYLHYKPIHLCYFEFEKPLSGNIITEMYCWTMVVTQQ